MNKKKNSKLPLIITLSVVGAAVVGTGIFAIVKLSGKKNDRLIEYPDVQKYFEERAEIISVTPVKDSKNTLSEKSVVAEMIERGFDKYPITSRYSFDGTFGDQLNASNDSSDKHPIYETYYVTSQNDIWVISVIDGKYSAAPSSYNLLHETSVPVMVSETEEIASYDSTTNSIYLSIPHEDALDVRIVERIDASTIESLDLEE
ncbi:MAG: hypothetical protein K6A80_06440 [Saccharofermentans sp.]|nr:hypothetical protein [Saccharofermentans sp.]